MEVLENFNLVPVGIVVAATAMLGFIVFFNNYRSITHRTFLLFSLAAIFWNGFNFLAYQFTSSDLVLLFLRLVLFFAVWYSFYLFQFFYAFPKDEIIFPRWYRFGLLPLVIATSVMTLTPLALSKVNKLLTTDATARDELGVGMLLFGLVVISLIGSGITILVKKMLRAQGEEQAQFRNILTGTSITFSLYILFNFIFPVVFNNIRFVPFGVFFTLPLVIYTTSAIVRHKLLNVKVLSTEILTFILAIGVLFEVILSREPITLLFRFSLFLLVLSVGILLIKSVIREVKQRELLERLTRELADANKKLEELDKARAEFISMASHQMRTPPSAIKWYVGSLLSGDFGILPSEIKEALEKVQLANNSQISLIEDMLNVSRVERGTLEFAFGDSDLLVLTKAVFDQLLPFAKTKNLKLVFKKPVSKLPLIIADKEKIRQVINNMIDNAIKYTKQGSVIVELGKVGDDIKFSVTDTGKGIRPEDQGKIFEKFSRTKDSSNFAAGLGLGLYVAKIIIYQHHGKIWAESKGEGLGSTFSFSLPIHSTLQKSALFDLTKNNVTPEAKK